MESEGQALTPSGEEMAASVARLRARMRLAERMTPAQREALEYPVTQPGEWNNARYHHLVDEKPGDTAWRVAVIVDATADSPDRWPCWHCTVVYGEKRKGRGSTAVPLYKLRDPEDPKSPWIPAWPPSRFWLASNLIKRALRNVGVGGLRIANRWEIHDAAQLLGQAPHEVQGMSGRTFLSLEEAQACLPAPLLERFTYVKPGEVDG